MMGQVRKARDRMDGAGAPADEVRALPAGAALALVGEGGDAAGDSWDF